MVNRESGLGFSFLVSISLFELFVIYSSCLYYVVKHIVTITNAVVLLLLLLQITWYQSM